MDSAHIVVMGVSGCGKSTVGEAVAERLGVPFADADDFHPEANVALMAGGTPLTDEQRWPWLDALVAWMAQQPAAPADPAGSPVRSVVACSALRRAYRDVLRTAPDGVAFVHLDVDDAELRRRVASRSEHFMPVTLLESQLATLEPLGDDEAGLTLSAGDDVPTLVSAVVTALEG
ncbi:hypothetical protein C8046_09685 [Serinibacter arcticus]|uniref:Gluconokinase n=1 Tax=Serinibacter arcticus TaxID=1655435 RepID=A0A2U1ZVD3_9MICO|nr:gluconokinase [Serinibacter arcticus]PWD50882.1 hypothetical protein C8046_09685 [Serinibacter arcticus]